MPTDIRDRVPARRDGVWLRTTEDDVALLSTEGDRIVVLNDTALALWELCDGRTTVGEILSAIDELFAVDPEQAAWEVTEALEEFHRLGVIHWGDSPA